MTSVLGDYLTGLRHHAAVSGLGAVEVLGTLSLHLAASMVGLEEQQRVSEIWPDVAASSGDAVPPDVVPPGELAGPDLLGWAYEALSDRDQRRRGLHYTPSVIAERLATIALDGMGDAPVVCDPACGGGAFLLAAGRALETPTLARRRIVAELLVGIDIDPLAVAVATTALVLWAGEGDPAPRVVRADSLATASWPHSGPEGFDVVVGNPPFQSQLGALTARSRAEAGLVAAALGPGAGGYADTAALFLLAAVGHARPGGRVLLIQPQSVLASRDTAAVRRQLEDTAVLEGLWVCDEPVFEAATRVCAPLLRPGVAPNRSVRRWQDPEVRPAPGSERPAAASWAPLAAGLRSVPVVALRGKALPELGRATAGFRREFYGLVPFVREASGDADERPLVTSGLIDPGECAWGRRDARFAKIRWRAPVVDLAGLAQGDPSLSRWVRERLVPKVLVATQTRVVEAVADREGRLVPSTPVVSVAVDPDRLWHVVAALSAPPVTAWALHLSAGTALSPDALKLSAGQVRRVPAPVDAGAWEEGARLAAVVHAADDAVARREALVAMGAVMVGAYEVDEPDALLRWWSGRLPRSEKDRDGR